MVQEKTAQKRSWGMQSQYFVALCSGQPQAASGLPSDVGDAGKQVETQAVMQATQAASQAARSRMQRTRDEQGWPRRGIAVDQVAGFKDKSGPRCCQNADDSFPEREGVPVFV
jgi:hypothetical protein